MGYGFLGIVNFVVFGIKFVKIGIIVLAYFKPPKALDMSCLVINSNTLGILKSLLMTRLRLLKFYNSSNCILITKVLFYYQTDF